MAQDNKPVGEQAPVIAKVGGPYTCKNEKAKRYFGVLVAPGQQVPLCPNCKKATSPVEKT